MKRSNILTTVAATMALAAPTALFAEQKISSIEVDMEASAIENEQAASFWTTVEADLETAIATRVVDRISDSGDKIRVDLDEISLATSFQGALGAESVLAGDVKVLDAEEPSKFEFYTLTISALQDGELYEGGQTFSTVDSERFYTAMVDRFADAVVERLK